MRIAAGTARSIPNPVSPANLISIVATGPSLLEADDLDAPALPSSSLPHLDRSLPGSTSTPGSRDDADG